MSKIMPLEIIMQEAHFLGLGSSEWMAIFTLALVVVGFLQWRSIKKSLDQNQLSIEQNKMMVEIMLSEKVPELEFHVIGFRVHNNGAYWTYGIQLSCFSEILPKSICIRSKLFKKGVLQHDFFKKMDRSTLFCELKSIQKCMFITPPDVRDTLSEDYTLEVVLEFIDLLNRPHPLKRLYQVQRLDSMFQWQVLE